MLVAATLVPYQASAEGELEAYTACASDWAEMHLDRPDSSQQRKAVLASYAALGLSEESGAPYLERAETAIQSQLVTQITSWRRMP